MSVPAQLSRFFIPSLLAGIFLWNAYAISQFGPLPNATMMASSSVAFLLVYVALRSRGNPIITALFVCLLAWPGAMGIAILLHNARALTGLTEAEHTALNNYIKGITTGGVVALVYVVLKGLWAWFKRDKEPVSAG